MFEIRATPDATVYLLRCLEMAVESNERASLNWWPGACLTWTDATGKAREHHYDCLQIGFDDKGKWPEEEEYLIDFKGYELVLLPSAREQLQGRILDVRQEYVEGLNKPLTILFPGARQRAG